MADKSSRTQIAEVSSKPVALFEKDTIINEIYSDYRLFVSGECMAMYYGDEPEEFKKEFDLQVECVRDALLGDLDYGTPD